jgi:hypothetical protein
MNWSRNTLLGDPFQTCLDFNPFWAWDIRHPVCAEGMQTSKTWIPGAGHVARQIWMRNSAGRSLKRGKSCIAMNPGRQ